MRAYLGLLALLISFCAHAYDAPKLKRAVNDYANVLSSQTVEGLSQALERIHSKGGPQVAVLTVRSLLGEPLEQASMDVAESWRLGTEDKDNGLLVFIATGDRKVRIEVGQGLEGDITDAFSKRVIDQIIVPSFRQGQFDQGVVQAVAALLGQMQPPLQLGKHASAATVHRRGGKKKLSWVDILVGLLMLFFFIRNPMMFLMFFGGSRNGDWYGGRGGGGGFGGFGGGGGGFSGGGASGSW